MYLTFVSHPYLNSLKGNLYAGVPHVNKVIILLKV